MTHENVQKTAQVTAHKKGIRKRTANKPTRREVFLAILSEIGNVTVACRKSKYDRRNAYRDRLRNPKFRTLWAHAMEMGVESLEDEAIRRAFEGVERPVTVAGKKEVIRVYSDTLLIFLLKGAKPEKYQDRWEVRKKVEQQASIPPGGNGFFEAMMKAMNSKR